MLGIPLPKALGLAQLLGDPPGQDKQRIAQAIQKTHKRWLQGLVSSQSNTATFCPPTNRSGLM